MWRSRKCTKRDTERFITPRRRRPNGRWCIWQRARANKANASTARAKAKGSKGSKDSKDKSKDKNKDSVECWNCGKRGHYSKDCWSKKNTNKGGSKGRHKPKNADTHNLDSKPSIAEPEVEIDEFNMSYLDVHALQQESERMRGSEWIKIGVDIGAGKTAWPQSITYGTTIPGDSDLTLRTATGETCQMWQANARCGLR